MLEKLDVTHPGQDAGNLGKSDAQGARRNDAARRRSASRSRRAGRVRRQSRKCSWIAPPHANPNPGFTRLHRLNRTEYANAVRDLLALEIDASTLLPADDSSEGFDNIADALAISPALVERYTRPRLKVAAGRRAIR